MVAGVLGLTDASSCQGNLSRALFQSIGINSHLFTDDLAVFGITWETHLWHVCEGISREV